LASLDQVLIDEVGMDCRIVDVLLSAVHPYLIFNENFDCEMRANVYTMRECDDDVE